MSIWVGFHELSLQFDTAAKNGTIFLRFITTKY